MTSCSGCFNSSGIVDSGSLCGTNLCGTSNTCDNNGCAKQWYPKLYASIEIKSAWNIPACGNSTIVVVSNISNLPGGSYLWNSNYGYLEITSFDKTTGQVHLINPCLGGSAFVGKFVPAYTRFILVPAPKIKFSSFVPYLLSDFVAPAVGFCVEVDITDASYIVEGSRILLGGAFYRVAEILTISEIRICNEGEGFVFNTDIEAFNSDGLPQYPIYILPTTQIFIQNNENSALSDDDPKMGVESSISIFNPSYRKTFYYHFNLIASWSILHAEGLIDITINNQHSAYVEAISQNSGLNAIVFPTQSLIPTVPLNITIGPNEVGIIQVNDITLAGTLGGNPIASDQSILTGVVRVAPRDTVILTGGSLIYCDYAFTLERATKTVLTVCGNNPAF